MNFFFGLVASFGCSITSGILKNPRMPGILRNNTCDREKVFDVNQYTSMAWRGKQCIKWRKNLKMHEWIHRRKYMGYDINLIFYEACWFLRRKYYRTSCKISKCYLVRMSICFSVRAQDYMCYTNPNDIHPTNKIQKSEFRILSTVTRAISSQNLEFVYCWISDVTFLEPRLCIIPAMKVVPTFATVIFVKVMPLEMFNILLMRNHPLFQTGICLLRWKSWKENFLTMLSYDHFSQTSLWYLVVNIGEMVMTSSGIVDL